MNLFKRWKFHTAVFLVLWSLTLLLLLSWWLMSPRAIEELYFPTNGPFAQGFLPVGSGHDIYYEELGNKEGLPVLLIHGGPGSGMNTWHKRLFDPSLFRIITYDQRGTGKSKYTQLLLNNDTSYLIEDINKLREHLRIEKWVVSGTSWGSTLGLAYAERHPNQVMDLLIGSIFLGKRHELRAYYSDHYSSPRARAQFISLLSSVELQDPILAYYHILSDPSSPRNAQAFANWSQFELSLMSPEITDSSEQRAITKTSNAILIEAYYTAHDSWLVGDSDILANVDKIRHIPTYVLQGTKDRLTPLEEGASKLRAAWPEITFIEMKSAGHRTKDNIEYLENMRRFAQRIYDAELTRTKTDAKTK